MSTKTKLFSTIMKLMNVKTSNNSSPSEETNSREKIFKILTSNQSIISVSDFPEPVQTVLNDILVQFTPTPEPTPEPVQTPSDPFSAFRPKPSQSTKSTKSTKTSDFSHIDMTEYVSQFRSGRRLVEISEEISEKYNVRLSWNKLWCIFESDYNVCFKTETPINKSLQKKYYSKKVS